MNFFKWLFPSKTPKPSVESTQRAFNRFDYSSYFDFDQTLAFSDLDFFYRKSKTLKRSINFLVNETLKEGIQPKELYKVSQRYLASILLYGFVLVDKKTLSILEPQNCIFHQYSSKVKKLVYLEYDDGIESKVYFTEDLAIGNFQPLPAQSLSPSPLESIEPELWAELYYREIKKNFLKNGGNQREAIYIASEGYTQQDKEKVQEDLTNSINDRENAGRPLVVFSREGRGNIQSLDGGYSTSDDEIFSRLIKEAITEAYGLPSRYSNFSSNHSTSEFDFARDDEQLAGLTLSLQKELKSLWQQLGFDVEIEPRFSVITEKKQNFEIRQMNAEVQRKFADAQINDKKADDEEQKEEEQEKQEDQEKLKKIPGVLKPKGRQPGQINS